MVARLELAEPASFVPRSALEAAEQHASRDRQALAMENAALVRQLREHGIVPASASSDEWVALYERCARVVEAASRLVAFLGTSKEMLEEFSP